MCGVFLLHAFKDINVTFLDLIEATNRQNGTTTNNSGVNVGAFENAQTPHRATSFSHLSSNSQSSLVHGSQISTDPAAGPHRTNHTRNPYITNGSVDSGDALYTTETAPLVHSSTDT